MARQMISHEQFSSTRQIANAKYTYNNLAAAIFTKRDHISSWRTHDSNTNYGKQDVYTNKVVAPKSGYPKPSPMW